ncbi:MAG: bifunctional oligoribonuclease/PAP phosphatase NrnA [Armatimonadota bacterium]|nr:bifunctional oligoribonuclease/PAP phosphatase NrnA [bacterium]
MMKIDLLKDAWARFMEARSFVLACHQRPDGDTLGSALGLAHVLRLAGKDVVVISEDGIPDNYTFLPESDTVVTSTDRRDFDIGVLIDSEGTKRIGSAADAVTSSKVHACVDHHLPSGGFGEIRVVDYHRSSTAEVVYELLEANDVIFDAVAATHLLTGIISDTGGFKFSNTKPRTFEIASKLQAHGADPAMIAREVYESRPIRSMKLLGRALGSLQIDESGRVVWATISKHDLDELGATDADTDSIVNHVTTVKGPKVAILFRESKPGSIRISLRSRDGVDVDRVARAFGGGGHKAAAGCHVEGSLDHAVDVVVNEVLKWME